jgi:hypothetical protein
LPPTPVPFRRCRCAHLLVRANAAERQAGAIAAPEAKDDDDVDWSEDVSEEAVRSRQAKLGLGVAALTMTDDLERPVEERLELFHAFVKVCALLTGAPAIFSVNFFNNVNTSTPPSPHILKPTLSPAMLAPGLTHRRAPARSHCPQRSFWLKRSGSTAARRAS